jgi:hypothetical protein
MPKFCKVGENWVQNHKIYKMNWLASNDIEWAYLAVGLSYSMSMISGATVEIPSWAKEALARQFEEYDAMHFDPLKHKSAGAPGNVADDKLLDEMARLTLDGYSVNKAAKEVSSEDAGGPSVRRLTRKWKKEWGGLPKYLKLIFAHPRQMRLYRIENHFLYKSALIITYAPTIIVQKT